MEHEQHERHEEVTYFINGEPFVTRHDKLKVRQILADAGFTPVDQYRLTRDKGEHVFTDYDHEIELHEGERFTATYLGPTPTS